MKFKPQKFLVSIILLLTSVNCFAQNNPIENKKNHRKGKLYFYWGWNGAGYTKSDISFKGNDYAFTLREVVAKDRQSKFSVDKYLNPGNMTIPQYNFRIGYFFKDNWDISLGMDHMKYVVQQGQKVTINGVINNSESKYDGSYQNDNVDIEEGFLEYEHTDGLNFANVEIRNNNQILGSEKVQLNLILGGGLGVLYPKTNVTLINKERHDDFNVAGYGISAVTGLNITFFKRFFIQSEVKGGYINLPNVRTSPSTDDSAKQSFFFLQRNIVFGGIFNLTQESKIRKK